MILFFLMVLQMCVIQIMIDNFAHIFGEDDHIICDNSQKTSDDIKTSGNTAGKSPGLKKAIDIHSEKTSNANTDKDFICFYSSTSSYRLREILISHQTDGRMIFSDFTNL